MWCCRRRKWRGGGGGRGALHQRGGGPPVPPRAFSGQGATGRGGGRVKTPPTQAGEPPLIPDWSIPYTGTPGSGTAVLPAFIISEDMIEYHWLTDPKPRVFQLGTPSSLASQMVVVKFGGVVVK